MYWAVIQSFQDLIGSGSDLMSQIFLLQLMQRILRKIPLGNEPFYNSSSICWLKLLNLSSFIGVK